jgi:urease accessory protein
VRAQAQLKVSRPVGVSAFDWRDNSSENGGPRCGLEGEHGGHWRLDHVRDAPPVAFRATPEAVYLVSTAAFPVGEDEVTLDVEVGPGAVLPVRSAASMIAWASSGSSFDIEATVGAGGALDWHLKPFIASGGCSFAQRARVRMDEGATLLWVEELVLGRSGEGPGLLDLRLDVDIAGRPLLRHQLVLGRGVLGWDSPAVLGTNRALSLVLLADPALAGNETALAGRAAGEGWAVMALEGPGVLAAAVGRHLNAARVAMDEALAGWAEKAKPGSLVLSWADGSLQVARRESSGHLTASS